MFVEGRLLMKSSSRDALFWNARYKVIGEAYTPCGIGTLAEKTVHKVLKFYIEPDEKNHEVNYLGYVADIMNSDGIYEIQTRSAERLIPKLERFLKDTKVTVVFPVIVQKYIRRLDKSTGEISEPRKSPKKESAYTALGEVYKIRRFLGNPNLKIMLVFLEADEYKIIGGSPKGFRASDKIPTVILGQMRLDSKSDFSVLVPEGLGEQFLASDFAKAAKIQKKHIFCVMNVLSSLGVISRVGKKGNAYVYVLQ